MIDPRCQSGVEAIESFVSSEEKQIKSTFRIPIEKNWAASSTEMISFVQQEIRNRKNQFQSCASKKGKGLIDSLVIRLAGGRLIFGPQSLLRFSGSACDEFRSS